jgi:hypothetical protein
MALRVSKVLVMSKQASNPKTEHWQALSQAHHLAPFSDYRQLAEQGPRIITEAKGVHLWDSEGHKILDGMAGLWCVAVGYGREELVEAAARQMHALGLGDDARTALGQLPVITERCQVVGLAEGLPMCGFRVVHVASFDPGHHRYQRYSRGLMSCMKAR